MQVPRALPAAAQCSGAATVSLRIAARALPYVWQEVVHSAGGEGSHASLEVTGADQRTAGSRCAGAASGQLRARSV